MARTKVEKTEAYTAVDDQGTAHTIDVWTTFVAADLLSGETQWLAGTKAHKMRDGGGHINVEADGSLVEVSTGRRMRRA
jgi:hypothetical protein